MITAKQDSFSAVGPVEIGQRRDFRSYVTIMSVYPRELTAFERFTGFEEDGTPTSMTRYTLPEPDPRVGYSLIRVYDSWQLIGDHSDPMSRGRLRHAPVTCLDIARSLIQKWAGDMHGNQSGYSIGVAVIAGDTPTQEEIDSLKLHQENYFNWLVNDADELAAKQYFNQIGTKHREAAEWLGVKDRDWYKAHTRKDLKQCLGCQKEILHTATVCEHCQTNLLRYGYEQVSEHYMTLEELHGIDPVVAAKVKKRLEDTAQKVALELKKQEVAKPVPGAPVPETASEPVKPPVASVSGKATAMRS